MCVCVVLCFVCVCGVVSRFFVCCTSNPYHHFQTRWLCSLAPFALCLTLSIFLTISLFHKSTHTHPLQLEGQAVQKKRRNAIKMFLSFTCFVPSLIPSLNLFERQNHLSSPKKGIPLLGAFLFNISVCVFVGPVYHVIMAGGDNQSRTKLPLIFSFLVPFLISLTRNDAQRCVSFTTQSKPKNTVCVCLSGVQFAPSHTSAHCAPTPKTPTIYHHPCGANAL